MPTRRMNKILTCRRGIDDSKALGLEISKMVLHGEKKKKMKKIITIKGEVTFNAVSTNTFLAKLRTASTLVSVISSTC